MFSKLIGIMALLFLGAPHLFSQREDYVWELGYRLDIPTSDTSYGRSELIFTDSSMMVKKTFNILNPLDYTNASISDSSGHLLFYTNGLEVYNKNYEIMPNGDGLNPGEFAKTREGDGYSVPDGALILPIPGKMNKYLLIHHTIDRDTRYWDWHAENMLTTLIDMSLKDGLGDVVYKNVSVYKDSLSYGGIDACRHANGRDWWILCPYFTGKKMFIFLLDSSGLHLNSTQNFPYKLYPGTGQAVFSPDGSKYGFFHDNDLFVREFFLCDFDRCNGLISNFHFGQIPDYHYNGIAFSPNSRFLYLATGTLLYQLDMNDPSPFDTKIQIDTVDGFKSLGNVRSFFGFMQLAPNGKIYICNGVGPKHLSTIERPDIKGKACEVRQHNISIVANSSMTNFPNFRLGPLFGSGCDTLNKLPIIKWDYKQDTLDRYSFHFNDESKYEIIDRFWDFGDPSSSDDTSTNKSPIHRYKQDGVFEVCLSVKNSSGRDTLCKQIDISTTATSFHKGLHNIVKTYPNPFLDVINIQLLDLENRNLSYKFVNQMDKVLKSGILLPKIQSLDLSFFEAGVYYLIVYYKGEPIYFDKIIKL
jgi:hypothetical protein